MTTVNPDDGYVSLMAQLFVGRKDVIGTEEGGCERLESSDIWNQCMVNHWTGDGPPVGVYPMVREIISMNGQGHLPGAWAVHWGCVDFDEGDRDSLVHACNLVRVLQHFDITSWIEKSRSKGYHVWVFLQDWTYAATVRRALLAACQIAQAPTKEINPKQETLAEDAVGNYVRLPYPPDTTDGRRQVWTGDYTDPDSLLPMARNVFALDAWQTRVDAPKLETLGKLWQPPVLNVSKTFGSASPPPGRPAERRLSGLAYKMYQEGPLSGTEDRSAWLWSFARELTQCDITSSEAREFLYSAHDHHAPKWAQRADGGRPQLDRMLAKAGGAA